MNEFNDLSQNNHHHLENTFLNHGKVEDLNPFFGKGPLMGLDLGEKTFGLALSDRLWMIASPLVVLPRTRFKDDIPAIERLCQEHKVQGWVVGFPRHMNGDHSHRCQGTQDFMKHLYSFLKIPYFFWDERLSTVAVTRMMLEADLSRKKRAKIVDKMAATYILQGALDFLSQRRQNAIME